VLWGACEPGSVKVNQTRELAAHGLNQASGPNTPIVARMGLRWDEGAICDFESTMDWKVTGAYTKGKGDWARTMSKIKQFITNTTYFFQFHQPTYSQGVNRMPPKKKYCSTSHSKTSGVTRIYIGDQLCYPLFLHVYMYEKTENTTLSSWQSKPQLPVTVNPRKLPRLVGSLTAEPHDLFDRLLQKKCEKRKNSMVLLSHEQSLVPGTTASPYAKTR